MKPSEQVIDFLEKYNDRLDFLMFPPGGGGEYFSGIISKYSDRYINNDYEIDYGNNKFISHVPYFFKIIASMCPPNNHPLTLDFFAKEFMRDLHTRKNKDFNSVIDEAIKFVEYGPRLIRIHILDYNMFSGNNTYEIFPDTIKWLKYCNYLKTVKALSAPDYYHNFYNVTLKNKHKELINRKAVIHPKYKEVYHWLNDHRDVQLCRGHSHLVQYYDMFGSFDNIFKLTGNEIVEFLNKNPQLSYNPMHHIDMIRSIEGKTHNIIHMSNMFKDRRYMGKIFNIESNNFDDDVLLWHETNLQILKKYNIDW